MTTHSRKARKRRTLTYTERQMIHNALESFAGSIADSAERKAIYKRLASEVLEAHVIIESAK